MDADLITPFSSQVQHVFSTMFRPHVEVVTPMTNEAMKCSHDVSGIISISGEFPGQGMLSMAAETAVSIVDHFTVGKFGSDIVEFSDAAGEMIDMGCLNAKSASQRNNISHCCPSVVMSKKHRFSPRIDTPCVLIPCKSDCGEIMLARAIRPTNVEAKSA